MLHTFSRYVMELVTTGDVSTTRRDKKASSK